MLVLYVGLSEVDKKTIEPFPIKCISIDSLRIRGCLYLSYFFNHLTIGPIGS